METFISGMRPTPSQAARATDTPRPSIVAVCCGAGRDQQQASCQMHQALQFPLLPGIHAVTSMPACMPSTPEDSA